MRARTYPAGKADVIFLGHGTSAGSGEAANVVEEVYFPFESVEHAMTWMVGVRAAE